MKRVKADVLGHIQPYASFSFWRFKIWLNNQGRTFIIPVRVLLQAQANNGESATATGVPRLNYPPCFCLKALNRRSKAVLDVSDLIF